MARNGEAKTSANRLAAAEKQRQALELRKAGATYDAIARQLGYAGPSSVKKAIDTALARTLKPVADEYRHIHILRLEGMLLALQPAIRAGDPVSIRSAIRVLERESRLLGLDAPIRVDIHRIVEDVATDLGLTDEERDELFADVANHLTSARKGA